MNTRRLTRSRSSPALALKELGVELTRTGPVLDAAHTAVRGGILDYVLIVAHKQMSKLLGPAAVAAAVLAAGTALYRSLVTGRITLDLGVGRRTRALGPLSVDIAAPPETVFAAAAPYAERRPRALMEKVHILERTDQMVLAAHHTPVGKHLNCAHRRDGHPGRARGPRDFRAPVVTRWRSLWGRCG